MDKDRGYFHLANFYTSAFLLAKGMELVNIENTNPQRSEFIFLDVPEREQLVRAFNFAKEDSPEVMVDARKFVMAVKSLKDKLYQERQT